jgi:hypothetical protein
MGKSKTRGCIPIPYPSPAKRLSVEVVKQAGSEFSGTHGIQQHPRQGARAASSGCREYAATRSTP